MIPRRMNTLLILSVLAFVWQSGSLSAASPPKTSAAPVKTTLCAIAKNPNRYDHKLVTFEARYLMPGIEGTALEDPTCSGVAIAAYIPDGVQGGEALRKAYQNGILGTSDKVITATWVGVFKWQPRQFPKRILCVRQIRAVTMVRK